MAHRPTARKTPQRTAVHDVIVHAGTPLLPREILARARARSAGIGMATVDRTLKSLQEEGLIQAVEIPGEPPRFEGAGKGHHHHFHCTSCERVFELAACCGHFGELTPKGFVLESHDLTLYGRCAECAARGR